MLSTLLSTTDYAYLVPTKENSILCCRVWIDALPGLPKHTLLMLFNGIFPKERTLLSSRHHALPDAIMLHRIMKVFSREALAKEEALLYLRLFPDYSFYLAFYVQQLLCLCSIGLLQPCSGAAAAINASTYFT